ncbi:hypothetical protein Tco_1162042, partial [Tanacetum coccineum]
LTFFLGLQVTQKNDGIFISQDKYVDEILKKFGFSTVKTESTPMETLKPLMKDENVEDIDVYLYRSMIGSLMYLTSSRPDIMFAVCACVKFQVTPKVSHLHAVKRIFRYLKGQSKLGLWYPKDSPFDLEAYTDSEYAGASLDRKSTTRVKNPVFHSETKHIEIRHHFIWDSYKKRLIQVIKIQTNHNVADLLTKAFDVSRFQYLVARWMEWSAKAAKDEIEVKTGNSKVNAAGHYLVLLGKKNADFDDVVDFLNASPIRYALTKYLIHSILQCLSSKSTAWNEFGTNIASAVICLAKNQKFNSKKLDPNIAYAEQYSGNIIRTQSMATLNEPIPQGTGSGSGPRCQETILRDRPAQTRFKRLSKQSNDPPLSIVNTLGSREASMKLQELMDLYTKLSEIVHVMENIKTAQDLEIINL